MAAPPLTHHDILALVEPYSRAGRQLDLAASDRIARRLLFKPVDHAATESGTPALRESLQLESLGTGTCRLTRTLSDGQGLSATLEALGSAPAALLAQIEAVPPAHQFRSGPGYRIARSYTVEAAGLAGPGQALSADAVQLSLCKGVIRLDGLQLTMTVFDVPGVAAELALNPTVVGERLDLPEDLLAVLGWDWARLIPGKDGWTTRLRLRRKSPARGRSAEAALQLAASHLAQTLAETPARYHERHRAARLGVVARRGIPLLTFAFLMVVIALVPRVDLGEHPELLLFYHVPTALIALSFCVQELTRVEIPPWPRASRAASWRLPAATPAEIAAGRRGIRRLWSS